MKANLVRLVSLLAMWAVVGLACNAQAPRGNSYSLPTGTGAAVIEDGKFVHAAATGTPGWVLTIPTSGPPAFAAPTGGGGGGSVDPGINGFRLTLTTAVPVTTSDVTAAGTLYSTPYMSGCRSLYVSGAWTMLCGGEVSLALTLTSGKNYDVFEYSNAGTRTIVLSSAWTNDTTRADALGTQDGAAVLSSDHTRKWVGTLRASASNQTEDSVSHRYLYNGYNQERRKLQVTDATDGWGYTTNAFRQANGSSANKFQLVAGRASAVVAVRALGLCRSDSQNYCHSGVGINSTTTNSATLVGGTGQASTSGILQQWAEYEGSPGLGYYEIDWLEFGGNGGFFYGDNGEPLHVQSGMAGWIMASNDNAAPPLEAAA